jgi:hypothetical protein
VRRDEVIDIAVDCPGGSRGEGLSCQLVVPKSASLGDAPRHQHRRTGKAVDGPASRHQKFRAELFPHPRELYQPLRQTQDRKERYTPPHTTYTMAKGARASSKKANRTKLRARVFGPAEKARAERIHAKLLATINQPKPEKTEMDTAEDCKSRHPISRCDSANMFIATTTDATKEDDSSKGSFFLTAPIPRSLSDPSSTKLDPARDSCELRNLCFQLGLCSDVVGFTEEGALQVAFDPLPPHWLSENHRLTVT